MEYRQILWNSKSNNSLQGEMKKKMRKTMMTITQVYCYQEFYCSVNITISSGSILKSELI